MDATPNRQTQLAALRLRAEEAVNELALGSAHPQIENYQQLLHELDVYQAEIELQNEDLQAALLAAETARDSYADLYNSAPVGYFTLNEKNIVLDANTTGVELLGGSTATIINQPFTNWVVWESQDQFYFHIQSVRENNKAFCELQLCRADGTLLDTQLQSIEIKKKANLTGCIRIAVMDISPRTQAEKIAKQYELQLHSAISSLPYGVVLVDHEERVRFANQLGQHYLAALATYLNESRLVALGNEPVEEFFARYANSGSNPPKPLELLSAEPSLRYFEAIAHLINGPQDHWLLIIRETTDIRDAERHAHKQELLAAVGQLAMGIAHDFNNILQIIQSYAYLVQSESNLSTQNSENLEHIIHQGQRAAGLIRQILDFSRRSPSDQQPILLYPILSETVSILERVMPASISINLLLNAEPDKCSVNIDVAQIQQVFINLALNAVDAMPAGGNLDIQVDILQLQPDKQPPAPEMKPGRWISVTISDSGTGIADEHIGSIFEPFFTTKEVGKGSGLGLAQAHGIIGNHDGVILVDSPASGGTRFTIYLPTTELPHRHTSSEEDLLITHGYDETILLVEDEPSVLDVIKLSIEHLGYKVLTAMNGEAGLALFFKHRAEIRLVLTDLTMPVMGGIPMAKAIYEQDPTLPIIALSGYPLKADTIEAGALPIVDWLPKPISLERLSQVVSQYIRPTSHPNPSKEER